MESFFKGTKMDISVVIPAYNEENFISNTIKSINEWMPSRFEYEVVVVDHGSSDLTAQLAVAEGATVVDGSGLKTIAALRNLGVEKSHGRILVFIDADITLSQEWATHISRVVEGFDDNPRQICGSHPRIPEQSTLAMKYWFEPKTMESSPTHIGSCHLITSRTLFDEIEGFPEDMETSEEFTLCLNATDAGAKIIGYPELIITHHGAPQTIRNFVKTEIWHGRGDWTSVSTMLSSKVAMLTLVFLFLHVFLLVSIFAWNDQPVIPLLTFLAVILLCLAASLIKFSRHGLRYIVVNAMTFYYYFFGRSLSLFSALFAKNFQKRSRGM
jgi:glycosyltransferase involved in cell wall biosynthesis